MPKPNPNESKDDFVKRCIPIVTEDGSAKDNDQAVAMCMNMFAEAQSDADAITAKSSAKMVAHRAPVTITACADCEGGDGTVKRKGAAGFESVAYSGGLVPGYTADPPLQFPYAIDLSGTRHSRAPKANLDHKGNQRVGHITNVSNNGSQLVVAGKLSAATPYRDEVLNSSSDEYSWEVSIEADLTGQRKIAAGKTATVNGRTIEGPAYVFSNATLTGIAFVSQGADDGNGVKIAASAAKGAKMKDFEKWLAACGVDATSLGDEQREKLEAAYKAQLGTGTEGRKSFNEKAEEVRQEQERVEKIEAMALASMREHPLHRDKIHELRDSAIDDKASVTDFELALLRGLRVQAGQFNSATGVRRLENDPEMIEAAICLSAGLPNIEKSFSPDILNAIDRGGMRNFGLQQLLIRVACANGFSCRPGDRIHRGNIREVLEYCFPPVTARMSGWSTISLPNILGAVANKELLAGYMEEDQTWREIAAIKPVNNFLTITSYRMLDDLEYELVGPGGDIAHGTLGEESYTRQAKTYAKMLGLTREDIINDDLGAFDDLRVRLGRGAAIKFNNIFWAAFMNNGSFFTSGKTNYTSGSTTNLGVDGVGLGLGVMAYRKMRTPSADGTKRIGASGGRPSILLVPPELEVNAMKLYTSTTVNTGGAASAESVPNNNIYANLYRPVVQDRLSDSGFTGYSATAWYLFGSVLKSMVVSFLNGQQAPTVESSDADFSNLGIQFRGYHDFGADQAEPLAGVKVKGAA